MSNDKQEIRYIKKEDQYTIFHIRIRVKDELISCIYKNKTNPKCGINIFKGDPNFYTIKNGFTIISDEDFNQKLKEVETWITG